MIAKNRILLNLNELCMYCPSLKPCPSLALLPHKFRKAPMPLHNCSGGIWRSWRAGMTNAFTVGIHNWWGWSLFIAQLIWIKKLQRSLQLMWTRYITKEWRGWRRKVFIPVPKAARKTQPVASPLKTLSSNTHNTSEILITTTNHFCPSEEKGDTKFHQVGRQKQTLYGTFHSKDDFCRCGTCSPEGLRGRVMG